MYFLQRCIGLQITSILLGVLPLSTVKMQWTKMGIFELYTRKYLANAKQYGNGYYQ